MGCLVSIKVFVGIFLKKHHPKLGRNLSAYWTLALKFSRKRETFCFFRIMLSSKSEVKLMASPV